MKVKIKTFLKLAGVYELCDVTLNAGADFLFIILSISSSSSLRSSQLEVFSTIL